MHLSWTHFLVVRAFYPLFGFHVEEIKVSQSHHVFGSVAPLDKHQAAV